MSAPELSPKYRPSFEAHEVIQLVNLLDANRAQTTHMGLDVALAKLRLLSYKIQNNFARPAYVSTGLPQGKSGHSGESLGIMLIDSEGELEISKSPADMAREALAKKLALYQAQAMQGNIQAHNIRMGKEINTVIETQVKMGNKECTDAVNEFYKNITAANTPVEYWKHIDLNWAMAGNNLTQEQHDWLIDKRKES